MGASHGTVPNILAVKSQPVFDLPLFFKNFPPFDRTSSLQATIVTVRYSTFILPVLYCKYSTENCKLYVRFPQAFCILTIPAPLPILIVRPPQAARYFYRLHRAPCMPNLVTPPNYACKRTYPRSTPPPSPSVFATPPPPPPPFMQPPPRLHPRPHLTHTIPASSPT